MHSALLVVVTLVASSAFTLPRPPLTRNLKFARPAADGVEDTGAADGMDAVAAPASVVVDDAVEPAAPTAPAEEELQEAAHRSRARGDQVRQDGHERGDVEEPPFIRVVGVRRTAAGRVAGASTKITN